MPVPSTSDLQIARLAAWPIDIPLTDGFAISRGTVVTAANVFVCVDLHGGATGYGECAPFTDLTGEDQKGTLAAIESLRDLVLGQTAATWRRLSQILHEAAPRQPAARCGLETAILDALCRAVGLPLWTLFGGAAVGVQETDVTIPILGRERSLDLAREWRARGFRILKMKVGRNLDQEIATILDICRLWPDVSFVVDANQALSETEALRLMSTLKNHGTNVRLLEQPVGRADLTALARLRRDSPFPIGVDESAGSRDDLVRIIRAQAADVVNLKIMKSGVIEALDMATLALSSGLAIMFGGMIETRLAVGCSLALVAGVGPAHTLDLDTPLLLAADPVDGGYCYDGPLMHLSPGPGHGAAPQTTTGDD
ncbi:MAG: dipeptide epimerase [candidate division Zixibacteria bacterium]|nr:dipeptide epimerase [candidate division Zixibacteria bacterium]